MSGTIEIKIKLEAQTRQDGNAWIAWCPPLDLYTQAESKESAMISLREAIYAWVGSCLERKVLREALEEAGFVLSKPVGIPGEALSATQIAAVPQSKPHYQEVEVSVPAYIAAELSSIHAPC